MMISISISIFSVLLVKNKAGTDGSVIWHYALTSSGIWPPARAAKALVTILSTMIWDVSMVWVPTWGRTMTFGMASRGWSLYITKNHIIYTVVCLMQEKKKHCNFTILNIGSWASAMKRMCTKQSKPGQWFGIRNI